MTNRDFYRQRSSAEHPLFVKVFEALPAGKLDWRPHGRSRSAEELIGHLIGHEQDCVELLTTGVINHRMQVPFKSLNDAVQLYRQAHAELEAKVAATDDRTWDEKKGRFMVNGHVAYDQVPYRDLMWLLLFDSLHHRGQLSTYVRPMGGKVPSLYGPSADDDGGQ